MKVCIRANKFGCDINMVVRYEDWKESLKLLFVVLRILHVSLSLSVYFILTSFFSHAFVYNVTLHLRNLTVSTEISKKRVWGTICWKMNRLIFLII